MFDNTTFPIIEMALDGAYNREVSINPHVEKLTKASAAARQAPLKLDREKVSSDLERMFDQMIRKPAQGKAFK